MFIVADGMGGHDDGQRASTVAVEELKKLGSRPSVEDVRDALARGRHQINAMKIASKRRAAGTTISGMVFVEQNGWPYWLVVNLGDSRTYRVVNGKLEQVSVDHSEAQELIDAGKMASSALRDYPRRNVITRVLGARTVEDPEYWMIPVEGDQRWMICSDGLTSELDDALVAHIVTQPIPAQQVVDELVAAAMTAGGRDNISVIIVDVKKAAHPPEEETIEDLQWGKGVWD